MGTLGGTGPAGVEPMRRNELPYLSHYSELSRRQAGQEEVELVDGRVRVFEEFPDYLLASRRWDGSFFLVRTPGPRDATGSVVPCTPEAGRRWVRAAVAHATTVDAISSELVAAHRRVLAVEWWKPWAMRRALAAWVETRERYERALRAAHEAYAPVGEEIRGAIRAEREKAAEEARERARLEAEERERRARLAERAVWGWSVVEEAEGGGRRVVHVFRHDVPSAELPASVRTEGSAHVDLAGLRRALLDLNLPDVVWDRAALRVARREAGLGFRHWWQELFYENYRTLTEPPPPPRSSRWTGGGTGTSGTGGYSGGFSCAGGF